MHAFIVRRGGELVGYLGDGPGPFISAAHSALGHPQLERVRYTSLDAGSEDAISFVVRDASDTSAAAAELVRRGFELETATHEQLFQNPTEVPESSSAARRRD